MNKRNHYSANFKAQVVIEVLREEATVNEIAAIQLCLAAGRKSSQSELLMMFKKGPSEAEKELKKEQQHVAELERKVGQLTYEVDWLKKKSEEIFKRKRS